MKYKAGDKVKIKDLGKIREIFPNEFTYVNGVCFENDMERFCGKIVTIKKIETIFNRQRYEIEEDEKKYSWTDNMIECKVSKDKRSVIYYEKVLNKDGDKLIKIVDWRNVRREEELPRRYLNSAPNYFENWRGDTILLHIESPYYAKFIGKGKMYSAREFGEYVKAMKKAGARLTQINKEIKEKKENWEDNKKHKVVI